MNRLDLALLRRWIRARVTLMLRNPRVTFFTFAFPLMFLVIFSAINGDVMVPGASGGEVRFAQFYAPSIGIFGLTMACYSNVIFGLSYARDERLLKRVRGTPLPMPVYLASWLTGAVILGVASVVLMFVVAVPFFGVSITFGAAAVLIVGILFGWLKTRHPAFGGPISEGGRRLMEDLGLNVFTSVLAIVAAGLLPVLYVSKRYFQATRS